MPDSSKPKVIIKQDSKGTWRKGDGKFTPPPIRKPKPKT